MELGHFKLITGFTWLVRHNPIIDWSADVLTFDSDFCASSCLTLPPTPPPSVSSELHPPPLPLPPSNLASTSFPHPSTPPPHPDLFQQVPVEYHDYLDVFSES